MATRAKELSDLGNSGHLNVHDDGTVTLEGGNVGIGTNNPTNLLHVKSTVNNGGVITIESTATDSYPFLRLKNDAREYQITAHGPLSDIFTIYDGTAGSHRLVISSSGNVGIGTTGPGFRLHAYHATTNVVGKIESGDDEVWLALTDVGTDSYGTLIGRKSSTNTLFKVADENVNERFTILEGGNVGIGTTSPQQILHIHNSSGNFSAEAVLTGRLSTGTPKAEVAFKRGTSGDGAMLVLRSSNSSGALIDAVTIKDGTGNVGIGTTNPERPLHVRGANAFVRIESTSASQNSQLDIKSTTATWSIGQNQVLANTGTLEFYNGSSSPVVIKTNGKVGIGTTNPTANLHIVSGNTQEPHILLQNNVSSGADPGITFADSGENYAYRVGIDDTENTFRITAKTGAINPIPGTDTDVLKIYSTGYVEMPQQPVAFYYDVTDQNPVVNGSIIAFDTKAGLTRGITDSNSKSRFTVPATGIYAVSFTVSGSVTTPSSGDGLRVIIKKNGSIYANTNAYNIETAGSTAGMEYTFRDLMLVEMTANQYIELAWSNVGGTDFYAYYGNINIWKVA